MPVGIYKNGKRVGEAKEKQKIKIKAKRKKSPTPRGYSKNRIV